MTTKNKGRNAEMRAKFAAGTSREEMKKLYNMTGNQIGYIIGYEKRPVKEVVINLTPYYERDNEIIKIFSKRNRKGALSMSHIEQRALVNTRVKI